MRRFILLIIFGFSFFNFSLAAPPTEKELSKTAEHIDKLIKRDSLNELIISTLKRKVDSLEGKETTNVSTVKTVDKNKVSGPTNQIVEKIEEKVDPEKTSLFAFILIAFGTGLLSLVTPCVFPMIPLTVTFFTNTTDTKAQAVKKATFYGLSIVIIYTLIGIFAGGALANVVSTHWIPNLIFFIVFIIFGLSFLGLFEIRLPSSFVNKVDAESEKGGFYGVFFMAFTLVLVSFSCTVPFVGFILVKSASEGLSLKPVLGMLAYSIAFAIPFTLFALFPEWLRKLPKSGGWMNIVKVVFGFVELALSLKFLSMIDQVYHLRMLDREIYIAIWVVVFILLGVYLLGKLRMPHDSEIKVTSVPRLILAIIPFTFAVYLFPGMFGAPLKALSGYLPPMHNHDFDIPGIIRENSYAADAISLCNEPSFGKKLKLPHGLKGYFTYEEAIKCAKEKNLPLFIDFTGHACVSCREVEANIWSDANVLKLLQTEFIIASLYVDDRSPLPDNLVYADKNGSKIKTLGGKNTDLSISRFGVNAQPYYVLIDPFTEEKLITEEYTTSVVKYLDFLNSGIQKFKKAHPKK